MKHGIFVNSILSNCTIKYLDHPFTTLNKYKNIETVNICIWLPSSRLVSSPEVIMFHKPKYVQ